MKTTKEMKSEIIEKYEAIPERQVSPGIYLRSVGSKYVTLLNTWGITHFDKVGIEEFYRNYIMER